MPETFFQWVVFLLDKYGLLLLKGGGVAFVVALFSTVFGFVIGMIVDIVREVPGTGRSKSGRFLFKTLNMIIEVYIQVFRGTPCMVQAMIIYYGLIYAGIHIPVFFAAIIILSVNTGAYMAEIIRGGIESVDKGQKEAAAALGLTHSQSMFLVILPQAIKNVLPTIGNELLINIKDTSVLNVISLNELFFMSRSAAGTYFRYFEVFFISGIIYLVMTITVSKVLHIIERKIDPDSSDAPEEIAW